MPRIVVPLDESPLAEEALPWAAALARAIGCSLHLVSVWTYDPELFERAGLESSATPRRIADALNEYLARLAAGETLAGLKVTTEARIGSVLEELVEVVADSDTSYVVLTSHGRGGLRRLIQGSVADGLVRSVDTPVLVVRPGATRVALDRILVTLDGSETSEQALPPARAIAAASNAEVHLLRVVNPFGETVMPGFVGGADLGEITQHLADAAQLYLSRLAEPTEKAEVRFGRPLEVVLDYARDNRCDIIAMATHGRGGVLRLALGSTADAVMRAADRLVLLIPDRA
jgi:nucleotide-binding universal stress UspA family protein